MTKLTITLDGEFATSGGLTKEQLEDCRKRLIEKIKDRIMYEPVEVNVIYQFGNPHPGGRVDIMSTFSDLPQRILTAFQESQIELKAEVDKENGL
jgi:hypothetical protein